jgi:ABC-type ATPase involved in cell division
MTLLSFSQVSKAYPDGRGETVVLNNVSLEIGAGDHLGVWGERRSGKSTLLRLAAGLEPPDTGSICFDGQVINGLSVGARARLMRRHGIALSSSDWRPDPNHRVVDHVALPLLSDGLSPRQARASARRTLARLDAGEYADMRSDRLARGELLRVGLARALVSQPRLLLIDEPAVLPSPSESEALYNLVAELAGEDLTIVVASEDLAAIEGAGRMMSISDGVVRSMDAVAGEPQDPLADVVSLAEIRARVDLSGS